MPKELELWTFVIERLNRGGEVMLLVVAESSGSSPGRRGYKMAVAADGALCGSVGGGVMETNLVETCRAILSEGDRESRAFELSEQVHRRGVRHGSGMICSGKQTVIFKRLGPLDVDSVRLAIASHRQRQPTLLQISPSEFTVSESAYSIAPQDFDFERITAQEFRYREKLGPKNDLYIVGGGHCALAVSELMSKMDFRIHILDDRPGLNTIEKNKFAHEITIIDNYESIADHVPTGNGAYVAVMTLGYASDAIVIRKLIDRDFAYFGVLGSRAKMGTLMKELREEGLPPNKLDRIRTPIGLPINSRTPEEIAVSIAAEIISVKNAD